MSKYYVRNSVYGLKLELSWVELNPTYSKCTRCNGSGSVRDPDDDSMGWGGDGIRCPHCYGQKQVKNRAPEREPDIPQPLIDKLIAVMEEFGKEYDDDWEPPYNNQGSGI